MPISNRPPKKPSTGKHWFARFMDTLQEGGLEGLGKWYSEYRAIVHSNEDPENLDRLQLIIPDITGNVPLEVWAFPVGMFSGKSEQGVSYGFHCLPEKGDTVWVSFEQGEIEVPLWKFGHWGKDEKPSGEEYQGSTSFWFRTPGGMTILFNDTKKLLKLLHPNGQALTIEDNSTTLGKADLEPAIKGDQFVKLMGEMLGDIGNLVGIPVINGTATATLNQATNWAAFESQWKTKFEEAFSKRLKIE